MIGVMIMYGMDGGVFVEAFDMWFGSRLGGFTVLDRVHEFDTFSESWWSINDTTVEVPVVAVAAKVIVAKAMETRVILVARILMAPVAVAPVAIWQQRWTEPVYHIYEQSLCFVIKALFFISFNLTIERLAFTRI